jgi:hypothetical protein
MEAARFLLSAFSSQLNFFAFRKEVTDKDSKLLAAARYLRPFLGINRVKSNSTAD